MEDNRGDIEDYKNRYGYDEKEAQARYHLKQARKLISEICRADAEVRAEAEAEAQADADADAEAQLAAAIEAGDEDAVEAVIKELLETPRFPKTYAAMFELSNVTPHFDALENLLVNRSLARQYPEGWGRRRQEGEGPG